MISGYGLWALGFGHCKVIKLLYLQHQSNIVKSTIDNRQCSSRPRSSMDRMSDSGSEGCGFDSRRGHKK